MKVLRFILYSFAVLFGIVILLLASLIRPDISVEELAARYVNEASVFLEADGMQVHYRDEGAADAPVLLLLHGTFASLHTWNEWTDILTQTHRVIRVDLPGFGLTGPQPDNDYSIRATLYVLEQIRREAGVERWSIAGNSLGARFAMAYAQFYPEQTDKLILVNGGGLPFGHEVMSVSERITDSKTPASDTDLDSKEQVGETNRISAEPARPQHSAQREQSSVLLRALANPLLRKSMSIITPKFAFRHSLGEVYYDTDRINPETVDRYYHLLRREGNRQAFLMRNMGVLEGAIRDHLTELR
ncbi:MAG: alpha/beta hydrolase, partial [Balneolales bacterium]|nr:alpha/beta hydrolase [Balneolales bacterium]